MESGIAIGISICALVVSIISPFFEYAWNKKINEKNLASEYFKEIFGDVIYIELPRAREYIHFDGNVISGTEELEKVMRKLRQKLIYYKKSDPNFYDGLLTVIQNFENHLVVQAVKVDSGSFAEFYNKVDDYIEQIYTYINSMYLGKKIKKK